MTGHVGSGENGGRVKRVRRIPFRAKVLVIRKDTGQRLEGEAYDLSMGGMYIRTLLPLGPGTDLDVEVDTKPLKYLGRARVQGSRDIDAAEDRPYGMAVEWVDQTPNQTRLLSIQIDDHVRVGGLLLEGDPYNVVETSRVARETVALSAAQTSNRKFLIAGLAVVAVVVLIALFMIF